MGTGTGTRTGRGSRAGTGADPGAGTGGAPAGRTTPPAPHSRSATEKAPPPAGNARPADGGGPHPAVGKGSHPAGGKGSHPADGDGSRPAPGRPGGRWGQAPRLSPAEAFDSLYGFAAPGLAQQAYLLTGRLALSSESVEYAFHRAWEQWPKVAVDRDPVGWVRAAVHDHALSPWHRLRRAHRHCDLPVEEKAADVLRAALLELPPAHRRALLLYDGLRLRLPDTAAETEASTPATGHRVLNARAAVAKRVPELTDADLLCHRLEILLTSGPTLSLAPPAVVRGGSEQRVRRWTRAAIGLTTVIVGATALTLVTAPDHYRPPLAPGEPVSGAPVLSGPQKLTPRDEALRKRLAGEPAGPSRLIPDTR
ncbi:sigma-70 family RNA polymerase sigma factor [Streptomyces sp. LP05-1]|uniref:Sigma-70 family RNA polymerase sigma factor n=1 Tax=Streptomyces pyxinae TaxID=2970734 RepID=A0ABT2CI50_9ACTN|nr:sigma-70 family RNA polymerase sigma factor [Streptomyces sp. LP05-1]MCS0637088.1 sigma-70 family RNA polymerase sigma factor [Streptomyces sp. LP05-1]